MYSMTRGENACRQDIHEKRSIPNYFTPVSRVTSDIAAHFNRNASLVMMDGI